MKKVLLIALSFMAFNTFAQNFEKKFQLATTFELNNPRIQWVDVNNDSLLDVVITSTVQNEIKFFIFKKSGNDSIRLVQTISTGFQTGNFTLTDIDNDNKIDIVITSLSGNLTDVFFNKGNFNFQKNSSSLLDKGFAEILFSDLNSDGLKDVIGADADTLHIYEQMSTQFVLRKDTALHFSSLRSLDFDNNGYHDIAFSGLNSANVPTTAVLLLGDDFKILHKVQVTNVAGTLETGDLNHDGLFDILISGTNPGSVSTSAFKNDTTHFTLDKTFTGVDSASMKIADFTTDGKADIIFFGKNNGIWKNWIKTFPGDSVSLPTTNVKVQDFGDYDRDGDLDLVQLRSDSIVIFNNNLGFINQGPALVSQSIGVQIYDRMFFYWKKSVDDHTDSTTLTYDLRVYADTADVIPAEFDKGNRHRLLVSNGNRGTVNYSLEKIFGNYSFQVQSIDNAFVSQTKVTSGVCSACANLQAEDITMCNSISKVQLRPHAPKAMWFSFSKGFLGVHDSLTYSKAEGDTIFSFNPASNPSCSSIRLFNIQTSGTDTIRVTKNIWNCEGSPNTLAIASDWTNVTWRNNLNSAIAHGNQMTTTLQNSVVYNAVANNNQGCKLKETFNLTISKPELKVESNSYQIAKGGSAQLRASGANNYNWTPSSTLDDATNSSPIATPKLTTTYIVIAKDTVGCRASAEVVVEVMEQGFIPTLFTPNGDGKNDELKIFGLTTASNFRFTIYNREGNIMFDTNDVAVALNQGWTGSTNGHTQPSGTYFWKIEGSNNFGETLTLNGKRSGAFLLVK